jgi:hypothetical protein
MPDRDRNDSLDHGNPEAEDTGIWIDCIRENKMVESLVSFPDPTPGKGTIEKDKEQRTVMTVRCSYFILQRSESPPS